LVTNYADAAARHWNDGKHLEAGKRSDNADQLYGFAAECAIKSAIIGMAAAPVSPEVQKGYWHHIDGLWDRAPVQQLSRNFSGLALLLRQPNPFANWSVEQRYHVSGSVTAEQLETHRMFTQRLLSAVQVLGTRREK
jgi:hypothetical protein